MTLKQPAYKRCDNEPGQTQETLFRVVCWKINLELCDRKKLTREGTFNKSCFSCLREAERKETPGAAGDTNAAAAAAAAAAAPVGGADAMADHNVQLRTKQRNKRTF